MRVVILYSELAEYSISCFRALSNEAEILLVHWPVNPEAPFKCDLSFCESFSRETLSGGELRKLVSDFDPDIILCSGWMDKEYVKTCKSLKSKAVTILSMDNHWFGTFKQQVARIVSRFTIRRAFDFAFVPGLVQKHYAMKLGYKSEEVKTGFYAADLSRFDAFRKAISMNRSSLPKRFLYLGRYVDHKGVFDLWNAFKRIRIDAPEWELWCVGTGEAYDRRVESEGIKHFGFVQPSELEPILAGSSVYILPSHFEPWGVSVQEMAAVGFPMILSDEIGSREAFLKEGENGYVFQSANVAELEKSMRNFITMNDSEISAMGQVSLDNAHSITPTTWSETLLSFHGLKEKMQK
ncbi:MAG: glycosyltransferase family 4 protein [Flavobacteriales bacterium]|nr:glycosyltransferase family 4 protein [Flavobacteriales bacterium]